MGMWPQRLGIGLALASIASLTLALRSRGRRWAIYTSATSTLTALTILSHPMTGIGLAASLTLHTLYAALRGVVEAEGRCIKARLRAAASRLIHTIITFLLVAFIALGLIAFWLIPLLETNSTYHNMPTIRWRMGPGAYLQLLRSLAPLQILLFLLSLGISSASPRSRESRATLLTAMVSGVAMWMLAAAFPFDGYIGLRLSYSSLAFLVGALLSSEPTPLLTASTASLLLLMATGPESYSFQVLWWRLDISRLMPFSSEYAYSKFAGLARYLVISSASLGFSAPLRRAYEAVRRLKGSALQVGYIALGVAALLIVSLYVTPHLALTDIYYPFTEELHFKLDVDFPMTKSLVRVMEWVRENVTENTYVMYQDTLWKLGDWKKLPVSHYFYLSSILTGKPQVGGCFGTRYITQPIANTEWHYLFGQPISWLARRPERFYRILSELGISYVVVYEQNLVSALRSRPDLFEEVFVEYPFRVFKTRGFNPIVSIESGVVKMVLFEPNRILVEYSAPNDTYLYVRQVKYPGWNAYVDGERVHIEEYYPDIPSYVVLFEGVLTNYKVPFMKVEVPAGEHRLELSFRRVTVGNTLTLATVLIIVLLNALYPLATKGFRIIHTRYRGI